MIAMSHQKDIKVVAHYLDGSLIKGTTLDFVPSKPEFHIQTKDGEVHEVRLEELKAVFFVKSLEGCSEYRERKGFISKKSRGKKVLVEFFDKEVLFGFTLSYTTKGLGFFMLPGDPNSNNEKVFIVRSSTKRVKIQVAPPKFKVKINS